MLNVFEISKMVRHSGPGIRTLVHFKGCPLRCIWCSTPESQLYEDELGYNNKKCIGCGSCKQICGSNAICVKKGKAEINRSMCTVCMRCVDECYSGALKRYINRWNVSELVKEIQKDVAFFKRSGGGVTFSGGEPLMADPDELRTLLECLKEKEINIGIDTTGCVPWHRIENVMPFTDFFLYDLKHMDSRKHKLYTGHGNELILENLKKTDKYKKDIYIRIPLISDINCNWENIEATCRFVQNLKSVISIDLMPYHTLGEQRYVYCGRKYQLVCRESMGQEKADEIMRMISGFGLPCRLVW